MDKIDGHLHLVQSMAGFNGKGRLNALGNGMAMWDTGESLRVFPEGFGDMSFQVQDALKLMRQGGVKRAVLLQGSLNGYQNMYTAKVVEQYPDVFVGAFSVDPFSEYAKDIVKYYVETIGFRILKLEVSEGGGLHGYHEPFLLDEMRKLQEIFDYLSTFNDTTIVIDYGAITEVSHQPNSVKNLAERYPNINFVVAHLSFGTIEGMSQFKQTLDLFKQSSNIYLDLSAIQDINQEKQYPYPKSQRLVRTAIDKIGAERLIWGSDAPLSATINPYQNLANWLIESSAFTTEELEAMYIKSAEHVYFQNS